MVKIYIYISGVATPVTLGLPSVPISGAPPLCSGSVSTSLAGDLDGCTSTARGKPVAFLIEGYPFLKTSLGVSINGGTPMAGWLFHGKSHLQMDDK